MFNIFNTKCMHTMLSTGSHVNHIIMSTTHHQVVGRCNSSEACEPTGENTLEPETLCFFGVMWLLESPKQGLCFRGCGKSSTKSAHD